MGSLRGETMAVRRPVVYPLPKTTITARRRDVGDSVSSPITNNCVRPAYGGTDGGLPRQMSSSSGRVLQPASPSPGSGFRPADGVRRQTPAVTTGSKQGVKSHSIVNDWTRRQHSDAFASDTEATSDRRRRQQTRNNDSEWYARKYISASDLRYNSTGHSSSRSSTSGHGSTSGSASILKNRMDGSPQFQTNGNSSSSSTIVGSDKSGPTVSRPRSSCELHKSRSHSQRQPSDSSTACSQQSRRVGFKNNVAVYRFDSDGEDSAGYSSTVSETSEQLDGHPRTNNYNRRRNRRQSLPQPQGSPPQDHHASPTSHNAASKWAAALGRSTAADRVGSPRHIADDSHYLMSDNVPAHNRVRSNPVVDGRPQLKTFSKTLYISDYDDEDDGEHLMNGSVGNRASQYHHSIDHTQTQRQLLPDEGCVLKCGSITIHNPVFIDRAHYDCAQAEKGFTKRLVLTCTLKHMNYVNPDCLVVKANRSGTRARVVFNDESNNRHDDEPSDQLLLPYYVNPYCLTAQLHGENSLVIEAPIVQ